MTLSTRRLLAGASLVVLVAGLLAAFEVRHHLATGTPLLERATKLKPEPDVPLRVLAQQAGLKTDPIPGGRLVVHKAALTLSFYAGDRLLKTYPIARGFGDLSDKVKRGDGRTPEGVFQLVQRVRAPRLIRAMDLWMRLDYPLPEHAERGLAAGLIDRQQYEAIVRAHQHRETPLQNTPLGGGIGLHLGGPEPRQWTSGCITLRAADGIEVYEQVRLGAPVTITK